MDCCTSSQEEVLRNVLLVDRNEVTLLNPVQITDIQKRATFLCSIRGHVCKLFSALLTIELSVVAAAINSSFTKDGNRWQHNVFIHPSPPTEEKYKMLTA
jgi:hypothetical protein